MKQYKSQNELLDYIISKGVKVLDKEDALRKLKKYSYYSIVNSYKSIFKTTDNEYKKDVSFDEIYALYEFDKNLRSIFLKYILEIETIIKSLLAEVLALNYGIENYLSLNNLDNTLKQEVRQDMINKINEEIDKQNCKHEAVKHYHRIHGFIPPFVLVKVLTLGELSKLYSMLKQADRQSISKEFKISDKLLKQILKNIAMTRNICAHNDRLFSFHSKFLISFNLIEKSYDNKDKSTNVYMIMKSMELLLDESQGRKFEELINYEINELRKKVLSVDYKVALRLMGFTTHNN